MSGVRLQEVPNTVIDLETFGILVNWSLRRGGPSRRFDGVYFGGRELLRTA